MGIKFKARLEPRTEDGGFGSSECAKCECKASAYLEIHLYSSFVLLCGTCVNEGMETINKAMVESYKNATSGGNR